MRRLVFSICCLTILLTALCLKPIAPVKPLPVKQTPDEYSRERVVLLHSLLGSCTGVEVRSPKGKVYTLTAGHCIALFFDETLSVTARLEDGREYSVKIVAKDKNADLLLLQGVGDKSVLIADKAPVIHEHIHTMTHGLGFPSYRTDGEVLMEQIVSILDIPTCFELFVTAQVYPGSSGGPILNSKEELVGIVSISMGETIFSGTVTLRDIKAFLKDR